MTDTRNGEIWTSSKIMFEFKKYRKDEFEVAYRSTLLISRLVPIFYLQHEFQVENKDTDRMTPVLDGFGIQPYTGKQQELDDLIKNVFFARGYTTLSDRELHEAVPELAFIQPVSFFGSQVTVEHILFFDLLDLCPD